MDNAEDFIDSLRALKAIGVLISIDDFGTGYSSLSYLQRFPVDRLKIDQSFVRAIGKGDPEGAIVRTVIALAHNLRFRVIAEGVEQQEQLDFLRKYGCDEAQGYFFCRPVPTAELADRLEKTPALS